MCSCRSLWAVHFGGSKEDSAGHWLLRSCSEPSLMSGNVGQTRDAGRPQHWSLSQPSPVPPALVWSTSGPGQPCQLHPPPTSCPAAPLLQAILLYRQTSCLQPGTFSPAALSWEEVCSAWVRGSRSVVWHLRLGEVRKQKPYWRGWEGRGGGRRGGEGVGGEGRGGLSQTG